MDRIRTAARTYPLVATTLLVGILGGVVAVAGFPDGTRWLLSVYALVIAAVQTRGMIDDIRHGTWGIDILAVTAIVSTVVVGEYWASVVVVLMLTGGAALEDYAAGRARRELSALLERAPRIAHRVTEDGTVEDVDIDAVAVGNELMVKPGQVVPVDCVLLTDAASFDESSLTGESMPVEHVRDDALMSGSVNGPSGVRVRATATAADSQYQTIIALVREASESKAPFVRLADRVAVPFTLVSFVIAGVAWAISGEGIRFAEVLVVATPCPLLIATPVAFMAGMSRAAKNGIIVKNGGTLERLARIRTAAFDKTGTLTRGTPEVVAVVSTDGVETTELLRLAASVEQYSGHALAASIVAAAAATDEALSEGHDVHETTAHGVSAMVDGRAVVVGKAAFVAERLVSGTIAPVALAPGQMGVYVGVDGEYAGAILLSDRVRPEARQTLAELHRLGVRTVVMLTGDAETTARHVAADLGVDDVRANCLPKDKVHAVASLDARPVMMVGDGVNDAPVLAAADVGIAMGARGSTAASESADVVIMLDDVYRTAKAVGIGQRTVSVAMQAIGIGVVMSLALMVLAAFGWIPAIVGAGLQEFVDLATILWALRASTHGSKEPADHLTLVTDESRLPLPVSV
ncbi:MAG TPA: heavy metal translocating P-type ATPase [Cellulomonadaceae bacterium]|nr:heavy metal translocating P-type ATPase [Cellulomonadaceae bacterium]